MKQLSFVLFSSLLLLSNPVFAHTLWTDGGGFMSGLKHPVLGYDHLLAMLSVGILSAQIGGRAIWMVPANFVIIMLLGGIIGMQRIALPSFEIAIAFSVFALGIAIAAGKKIPYLLAMAFVGIFAIFHGYAHGVEMPFLAKPLLYALGFTCGTAAIHIAGVFIGLFGQRIPKVPFLRILGIAIAGIGVFLLAS